VIDSRLWHSLPVAGLPDRMSVGEVLRPWRAGSGWPNISAEVGHKAAHFSAAGNSVRKLSTYRPCVVIPFRDPDPGGSLRYTPPDNYVTMRSFRRPTSVSRSAPKSTHLPHSIRPTIPDSYIAVC
jgi:hypothetical protein